jgi:hypothetical protein
MWKEALQLNNGDVTFALAGLALTSFQVKESKSCENVLDTWIGKDA